MSTPTPEPSFEQRNLIAAELVGRDRAWTQARQFLDGVREGMGKVLLISGEAGIGKSRLLSEICIRALVIPFTWQIDRGYCYEPDRHLPYAPLIDLIRRYLAIHSPDEALRVLGPGASLLCQLVPELAEIMPPANIDAFADAEPAQRQRHLFEVLTGFLMTRTQPGLIVLEDMHWCDESTLAFLEFLVRHLTNHAVGLILTYRTDEVSIGLRHLIVELDRTHAATEVELKGLDRDDTRQLISIIFDHVPVRKEFAESIQSLTDGNPFFIEETLKSLVASGDIYQNQAGWSRKPLQSLRIPRSVDDAVRRRVSQLSGPAREVLLRAAVVGRSFSFDLLRQLTGKDEYELITLAQEWIAAQLVIEQSADMLAFRHALTRQAIYSQLLARERRVQHRAVAETLERIHASSLDAWTTDLAYHFYEAEDWSKAMRYAQQAAKHAQSLFSMRAAVEHYTRAIDAAQRLMAVGQVTSVDLSNLHYGCGKAYELLEDFEAARSNLERAGDLAKHDHNTPLEWQVLIDLGFLWTGRDYIQAGRHFQSGLKLAESINDSAMIAQTLNRLGNWHMMTDQPSESMGCHERAIAIYEQMKDQRGIASTLDLLGIAHFIHGNMVAGAAQYERALAIWRNLDERQWMIQTLGTYSTRGGNYLFATAIAAPTTLDECRREGEEALRVARALGWSNGEVTALLWMGIGLACKGDWARAYTTGQEALQISLAMDHTLWVVTAKALLGAIYLDLCAWPLAQQEYEQAVTMAKRLGSTFVYLGMAGYLGLILVASKQLKQAREVLDEVLQTKTGESLPMRTESQRRVWHAQAELELALGHPDRALEITDRLMASYDVGQLAQEQQVVPVLWRVRGCAFMALGRLSDADTVLAAALSRARILGNASVLWRLHADNAQLRRRQRRSEEAEIEVNAARQIIHMLAEHAPDDALRHGFISATEAILPILRPPTQRQAAKQESGGLTARELEVANLIAQGVTNRGIATQLVLSERTIEKHIENVMAKLSLSTRAQIAVWITARRFE